MLIELTKEQEINLTSTEKNVIDWINENEILIPQRSINEIADESFVSPATVSRAIRKCGFSGIAEMKYKVSAKMKYKIDGQIVNEIFQRSITECNKTIEALNVDTILRVIRYIKFSKKFGLLQEGQLHLLLGTLSSNFSCLDIMHI